MRKLERYNLTRTCGTDYDGFSTCSLVWRRRRFQHGFGHYDQKNRFQHMAHSLYQLYTWLMENGNTLDYTRRCQGGETPPYPLSVHRRKALQSDDKHAHNEPSMRPTTDQSKAQHLQDMRELGHSQEAGVWVPKTHTHAAHPPAARTRHRTHTAHGRRAPTSPPSAAWALCRLLRRIPSTKAAEEAHAKREKPELKAKGADRKA
jgi:hypothetical protein